MGPPKRGHSMRKRSREKDRRAAKRRSSSRESRRNQAANMKAQGPSGSVDPRKSAGSAGSVKPCASTDGKMLPAKQQPEAKLQDVAGGVVAGQLPRQPVVDLEEGPEMNAYEYGLDRYGREPKSYLSNTEMSYIPAPEPERSCFQRNLQAIIMVTFIVVIAGLIVLDVTSAPSKDSSPAYPTPCTESSTRDKNYTGVVEVSIQDFLGEPKARLKVFTGDAWQGTTEEEDATDDEAPLEESSK